MSGRNGYMTHEEFKDGCQREWGARPEVAGWTLIFFAPEDFGRVWPVRAMRGEHEVTLRDVFSASATTSTPHEVVELLVRMIRDLSP